MNAVFADSFFFFALLSKADAAHERATSICEQAPIRIVTTAWVLTEVADGLAGVSNRNGCIRFLNELLSDPDVLVVPASEKLFRRGLLLYSQRDDKSWSLTDCISFVVMEDEGIRDALTADRHFEQAGFRALLK
jgi:predicted nucleic acid-binding protein